MNRHYRPVLVLIILSTLLTACGLPNLGGNTVPVSIVYGSEKEEWLEPLVEEYNAQKRETSEGSTIVVEVTPMGSIESAREIVEGAIKPTVWSPASSIYIPVANAEWRRREHLDRHDDARRATLHLARVDRKREL